MNRRIARLSADTPAERRAFFGCALLAALLHVGSLFALATRPAPAPPLRITTEIELAPPPPPAAKPPEPEPPAPEPPPELAKPAPRPRAKPAPAEPAKAPAGPLLTAADTPDAPNQPAPVRFVSDPNGRGYGSGLVSASPAAKPAPPAPPPSAAKGDGVTPADQLQRQARWTGDDCRGYFPDRAQSDLGLVALLALVKPDGAIARLDVQSETPPDQGFARAARACLQNQRFEPALDKAGKPALARTLFKLRFSR